MAALSIHAALAAHAARSNRTWDDDRLQTVGASEIGQCSRKTWFSKFSREEGVAQDGDYADRWGAKVRGTVYENEWWVPALRGAFGDQLLFAGEEQRSFYTDFLSATPDGLVTGLKPDALAHLGVPDIEGDCLVVECKTADPRTRLDGPKPEHRHQVIVQLGLIRTTTPHKPTWGLISYTDTSFWDEVKEFPIRFDAEIFANSLARASQIMTAHAANDLRPEGWIAGGRECEFCPFTAACGRVRVRAAKEASDRAISGEAAATIGKLAQAAKAHSATAKAEAAKARALEDEIKLELSRARARSARHGAVSVTWSTVKGRESTDIKALRAAAEAAGVKTGRFTTAGDPADRLTITVRNETQSETMETIDQ